MKTENDYRIKIEEWKEITEMGVLPIIHKKYIIQKRYSEPTLFEKLLFKCFWYSIGECDNLQDAIIGMRNCHNRDYPSIKYRYLE